MPVQQEITVGQLRETGKYWGKIVCPLAKTYYLILASETGGLRAISLPGSPMLTLPDQVKVTVLTGERLLRYITEHDHDFQSLYTDYPSLQQALENEALS